MPYVTTNVDQPANYYQYQPANLQTSYYQSYELSQQNSCYYAQALVQQQKSSESPLLENLLRHGTAKKTREDCTNLTSTVVSAHNNDVTPHILNQTSPYTPKPCFDGASSSIEHPNSNGLRLPTYNLQQNVHNGYGQNYVRYDELLSDPNTSHIIPVATEHYEPTQQEYNNSYVHNNGEQPSPNEANNVGGNEQGQQRVIYPWMRRSKLIILTYIYITWCT